MNADQLLRKNNGTNALAGRAMNVKIERRNMLKIYHKGEETPTGFRGFVSFDQIMKGLIASGEVRPIKGEKVVGVKVCLEGLDILYGKEEGDK